MPLSRWLSSMSCLFVAVLLGASYTTTKDGDVPDTSKWKVIFSDKFDRGDDRRWLEDRAWRVGGRRWCLEGDAPQAR